MRIFKWAGILCALVVALGVIGCRAKSGNEVVVYTSQDQVYAEPILREFTAETGIEVKAVYDSEAVKTVGLVNRLIAEKSNPQCDVFWNNEELRTHQLAARGVVQTNWLTVGYRSRRIVINTNLLNSISAPKSLSDLTNAAWRGKFALAYPLFGTTATHFLALRQTWGQAGWTAWCRALQANQPMLLDGNSVVVKMVGKGEVAVGLTDIDDILAGQREGLPVVALPIDAETLLIPNTISRVVGRPESQAIDSLLAWFQRPELQQRLVAIGALEAVARPNDIKTITADWSDLLAGSETGTTQLKEIFLR